MITESEYLILQSKKLVNSKNDYLGIDGMKCYKNSLIAIINGWSDINKNGVYRYYLSDNRDSIVRSEKLVAYDENFDIPTTFAIHNDCMYFTINSQMMQLDSESNTIKDKSKLKPYVMMKVRLN